MANRGGTAAKAFTAGARALNGGNTRSAFEAFAVATDEDPSMCDAWLGQIAALGAERAGLREVEGAYRSIGAIGRGLSANSLPRNAFSPVVRIQLGLVPVDQMILSDSDLRLVYAALLFESSVDRREEAAGIVRQVIGWGSGGNLAQYIQVAMLGYAQRWPDMLDVLRGLVWEATDDQKVFDACARAWLVKAYAATGNLDEATRAADSILNDETTPWLHPMMKEHKAFLLREKGDEEAARRLFQELYAIQPTPHLQTVMADPKRRLVRVSPESIASRTNPWDPDSGRSVEELHAEDVEDQRGAALEEAHRLLAAQIGNTALKRMISRMEKSLAMNKRREALGKSVDSPVLAWAFTGPPGTGKTTIARAMGLMLYGLGILESPDVVEVTPKDLIGEHLGQTGPKTSRVIDSALGKILFIDEAYGLYQEGLSGGDAFGSQAIEELLARMTRDGDKFVVIIAGYEDEIDNLLDKNPGLVNRFTNRISFERYNAEELLAIFELMAGAREWPVADDAKRWLLEQFEKLALKAVPMKGVSRPAIDKAGNGRFCEKLVQLVGDVRDERVFDYATEQGIDIDELPVETVQTITEADISQAYDERIEALRI